MLDEAQYAADDGPCLHAYRTGEMVRVEHAEDFAARWPSFASTAADGRDRELAVDAAAGEVRHRGRAGNLYASQPMTFTDSRVHLAELFAEQAALAVTNAEVFFKSAELTQNLTAPSRTAR